MLTTKAQRDLARAFVSLHKFNDPFDWQPLFDDSEEQFEGIYFNIVSDVYGIVSPENTIEICSFDSKTGNPVIFDLEV